MVRAAGSADRAAQRIERRFQAQNRRVAQDFNQFGNQVRTVLATIGVGLITRDVVQLGDAWTRTGNALAFAGIEAAQLATVQQIVADIASRTRSDLEATAELFARMLRSSEDLGASLGDVAAATEIVSKALAGASQSERAGAIRQLGQALGAGILAGDELRSILENSRPLAEAIAAEFGVAVGQLRELGKRGELESRRVFEAIIKAGPEIEAAFGRVTFTVADEFVRLRTEATRWIGTSEQTSQANRNLAGFIKLVADNFDLLASAVIVTASVLGGALAAQAVVQVIRALHSLTVTAGGASKAITALGGAAGIILTVAASGFALLATQTDIFTSRAEAATRASNSLYSALQIIVSLGDRLEETAVEGAKAAEATEQLGEAAAAANDALGDTGNTLNNTANQMGIAERASLGLAEAEKQRAIATLEAARADQEALIAATLRAEALAGLLGQRDTGDLSDPFGATHPESIAAQRRIADARQSIAILQDALGAVRTINSEFFAPAEAGGGPNLRTEAAAAANELERAAKALEALGDRALSDLDAAVELERQRDLRDLEIELQLARARGDEQAIVNLERRLEIEQRIAELRRLGIEGDEATARAEAEVAALETADIQGRFRDWFRGGVMSALDGDLGDFFENWLRDAARRGLENALNQVADLVFKLFSDAFAQSGGSSSGGDSSWVNAIVAVIGSFFGGGMAGGGPVNAGRTYMVGERGPELFKSNQPGVIVPNHALAGGASVNLIDNRTINFSGTSEELKQLERAMAADRAARYSETAQIVNAAIGRRHIGKR